MTFLSRRQTEIRYGERAAAYRGAVHSAVFRVRESVIGAETITGELEAEAWWLVEQHHERWERDVKTSLRAFASAELWRALCNFARTQLTGNGYSKTGQKWGRVPVVIDPANLGRVTAWNGRVPDRADMAPGPEDQAADDGPDVIPGIYGRSPWWARQFSRMWPEATTAFLRLDDEQKPANRSLMEWRRRQDRKREKLRGAYAREIEATDAFEEATFPHAA